MEMNQFETMCESSRFQHLARGDETRRIQPKLRVLTAARRPFTRTFAVKANLNPDHRLETDFSRSADRLLQLFEFLDNNDDALAELASKKRDANKRVFFVPVADDQAFRVFVHRERCHEFLFAARLQTK